MKSDEKLEIKQAKQRKKSLKPLSKADQEAIKLRIETNKKLAPHFFGEIGILIAWLKPAKKKLANRDRWHKRVRSTHGNLLLFAFLR